MWLVRRGDCAAQAHCSSRLRLHVDEEVSEQRHLARAVLVDSPADDVESRLHLFVAA